MKNDVLVSVILPIYNAEKYLANAIESILWQTFQDWELIAIDDGSKDSSLKLLQKYAAFDKRIKVFKNIRNKGIGYCMNLGLSKAKGRFIARQDADDISLPKRLEKQIKFFQENSDVGILGAFMVELKDEKLSAKRIVPCYHDEIEKGMFINQAIQNPTLMLNRTNIPKKDFWYNEALSPVDELDFFFRTLRKVKFANLPDYLVIYRKHQNNSSLKNIKITFWLTFFTRIKAVLSYKYRPTFQSLLIHWLQSLIVFSLPNIFLYKIFQLWKHSRIKEMEVKNILTKPYLLERQIQLFLSVSSSSIKSNYSIFNLLAFR